MSSDPVSSDTVSGGTVTGDGAPGTRTGEAAESASGPGEATATGEPPGRSQDAAARVRSRRRRSAKLLVIALWIPLTLGARVLETRRQGDTPLLDDAWKIGLAERWRQGEVAGRDFSYTYGPAAQAIAALGATLHRGESPIAVTPMVDLAFMLCVVLLIAGILWAIPEAGPGWTVLALAGLEVARVPEHYAAVRTLTVTALALAMACSLAAPSRARRLGAAVLAGSLGLLAQLLTADLLAYAMAVVALSAALTVLVERGLAGPGPRAWARLRPAIESGAAAAAVILLGNLAIALAAATPERPFGVYHRDVSEIAEGYALTMGLPWLLSDGRTAGLVLSGGLALGWLGWRLPTMPPATRARALALVAAALVSLRGALTRSDPGHVALALTPATVLVLVAGALGARAGVRVAARRRLAFWGVVKVWGVLGLAVVGWLASSPMRDPTSPWRVARAAARPAAVLERLDRLRDSEVQRSAVMPRGLRRLVRAARRAELMPERLAVVPYQLDLAIAARAEPAGEILQAYSAHLPATQRRFLEALWRDPDAGALLALEVPRWPAMDGVATAVRLPVLLRGLLERYRPVFPRMAAGFLLLVPRERPAPLAERGLAMGPARRSADAIRVPLPDAGGCRLLELELEIRHGPRLLAGRAAPMELAVELGADAGRVASRLVTLDRSRPFPVLVPLAPPERAHELWLESQEPGPAPRAVEIRVLARGALDVAPSLLEVRSASCLVS